MRLEFVSHTVARGVKEENVKVRMSVGVQRTMILLKLMNETSVSHTVLPNASMDAVLLQILVNVSKVISNWIQTGEH